MATKTECSVCSGSGVVATTGSDNTDVSESVCSECHGMGQIDAPIQEREMTEAEYREILGQMRVFVMMAASIDSDQLQQAVRMAEHSDTLAPFFDPTAWMQKGHLLRQEIAAMRALQEFKRAIAQAVERNRR